MKVANIAQDILGSIDLPLINNKQAPFGAKIFWSRFI
jgi:hypothetical protein